jgi:hypothetical protein
MIRGISQPGAQLLAQQFGWNSPEQLEGTLRQGGVATFPEFANKLVGIGAPLEKAFAERPGEVKVIQPDEGHAGGGEIGGPIVGPGSGTSDSIVMNAGSGDFILKESAARRAGRRVLDTLHGYAGGGPIRVSNGEEYFPRTEVSRIGIDVLNALNAGSDAPKFAGGGDLNYDDSYEANAGREATAKLERLRQSGQWVKARLGEHSAGDFGGACANIWRRYWAVLRPVRSAARLRTVPSFCRRRLRPTEIRYGRRHRSKPFRRPVRSIGREHSFARQLGHRPLRSAEHAFAAHFAVKRS